MRIHWSGNKFLCVYAGFLTFVFAGTVLLGFVPARKVSFDEISVRRINIVEPDGTLRLVLSDKQMFPGIFLKGKEHPHPNRQTAGILFFNDEGTENGGLIFGGMKNSQGQTSSYGHLSFDEYEQDQVMTIDAEQDGDQRDAGLSLVDDPRYPIGDLLAVTDRIQNLSLHEKKAELAKFKASHGSPHPRLYLGRDKEGAVALRLKDKEGRDRFVIQVSPDGASAIRFLDSNGKLIREVSAQP